MTKIWQEFYCTISGGGCGGYFMIKLNLEIDHVVEIVCPNCNHRHQRKIEKGKIKESGRFDNKPKEEIVVPKSAYSKEPKTIGFKTRNGKERDGVLVTEPIKVADQMVKDLWLERFGAK